jgi:hypothetical protein
MRGVPPLLRGVEPAPRCHDAPWLLDGLLRSLGLVAAEAMKRQVPRGPRPVRLRGPWGARESQAPSDRLLRSC